VQAVRRVLIAARAGVHSDAASLAVAETLQDLVVQGDEAVQDASAGVELEGEPSLGEVKLGDVRASLQRAPDVGFCLVDEVAQERLARVAVKIRGRIEQAQRGRSDD